MSLRWKIYIRVGLSRIVMMRSVAKVMFRNVDSRLKSMLEL